MPLHCCNIQVAAHILVHIAFVCIRLHSPFNAFNNIRYTFVHIDIHLLSIPQVHHIHIHYGRRHTFACMHNIYMQSHSSAFTASAFFTFFVHSPHILSMQTFGCISYGGIHFIAFQWLHICVHFLRRRTFPHIPDMRGDSQILCIHAHWWCSLFQCGFARILHT